MNQASDPFVQGIGISVKKIKIKHFFHRLIFFAVMFQGIRGLYVTVKDIFFVYPKLSLYYQQLSFDQSAYIQIVQQAVLVSVSSFFETAIGLTMMVKKSHAIKTIHALLGIIIFLLSLYLKKEGAIPDFKLIEELAYAFSIT